MEGAMSAEIVEQSEKPERRVVEPDLSAEIAQSVARAIDEKVTCRRISGRNYRCNWWSPSTSHGQDNPRMGGLLVTTHVVRKSQFLNVTKTEKGLMIKDASAKSSSESYR
jgi:hypothetical protein